MAGEVHEVVIFRLRPGVAREAFVRAAEETVGWLRRQPGMLERTLLAPEDSAGTWVDTARWSTLEEAQTAAAGFEREFADCDFEQMIDPESVQMLHLRPVDLGAAIA